MPTPLSYKIAQAFKQIDEHPAFTFLDEKWKRFARKLAEKDAELSSLSPTKYAQKYDEYIAALTRNTETTKSAFDKYQGFLTEAGKKQLESLGYSEKQVEKLYSSKEGRKSRDRILGESISAEVVSIGPSGKLTVFEAEEEVVAEGPPDYAPLPSAPAVETFGEAGDFLTFAVDVADKYEGPFGPYFAESILDAANSVAPGMDEEEVTALFVEAHDALQDSHQENYLDAVDGGPDESWGEIQQAAEARKALAEVLRRAVEYAKSEAAPTAASLDPLLEEELLEQTEPASPELTSLAADIVALAQEANRTSAFRFSELATEITRAGAPALAQQVLKMLKSSKGMAVKPPTVGAKLGTQLIAVGEKKYGLSGPILVKVGEAFRNSHPSSVMESANAIYLAMKDQDLLANEEVSGVQGKLTAAATRFEELADVEARSAVFDFAILAAHALSERGVAPMLPTKVVGVHQPPQPAGIIGHGPDPVGAKLEAEQAEAGVVLAPKPAVPPKPSPLTEQEEPSIASPVPSQGELIELIAGTNGVPSKYLPLIAKTYNGYNDEDTIRTAAEMWLKGLLSKPNNRFVLRWTTASPELDLSQGTVFTSTHQLSGAADGNQDPNSPMWRQVAIPIPLIQEQTRAYLDGSALVKSPEQYEAEFAGASLQGPPQETVSGVPESLKTLYYYIGVDDDGVMAVHVTPDVVTAILESQAFTVEGDPEVGNVSVSNAFGTVTLADEFPLHLVEGAPEQVTGFLVMLEKYRLASCGSVICVSALLTEKAEEGEITVETMRQGASARTSNWKNAFSSQLVLEVESVSFTKNARGQFSAKVSAGDESYNLEVLVKAVPGENSQVRYGICVREGGHELFKFTGSAAYSEFVRGTELAVRTSEEALKQGISFGVSEKVVTIPGDGLSSGEFSSILEELRKQTKTHLAETVSTGLLLNGKSNKKLPVAAQPRA